MMSLAGQGPRLGLEHMNQLPFAHGKGDVAQWLMRQSVDVFGIDDHFTDDTINVDHWLLTKDTNATDFAVNLGLGGRVLGQSSTTADSFCSMLGPAIYRGDEGIYFSCRFQIDDVAEMIVEMGLVDAVTDKTLEVNSAVTPTIANGADDVAVLMMDTDFATATLLAVAGEGATDVKTVLTGITVPTVDKWYTATIIVQGNDVYWSIEDDSGILEDGYFASGTEGTSLMAPWVIFGTRDTTDKAILLDRVTCLGIVEA